MTEAAAIWMPIDDLIPWADNPRDNSEAIPEVAASIKRFGFASPIIARTEDNVVIAGHTRLEAARSLGLDRVPVRHMDLDPADSRLLALADNKVGEIADWNDDKLAEVLRELNADGHLDGLEGLGFDESELDELLQTAGMVEESETDDEVPEVPADPVSQPGEVYELGPHRLVCGDSTDPDVWARLMGDERADLMLTDPPYCSGGWQESGKSVGSIGNGKRETSIVRDTLSSRGYQALMRSVLQRADVNSCAMFTDWKMWVYLFDIHEASGLGVKSMVIWDKGNPGMGLGFRPAHELVMVSSKESGVFSLHHSGSNVIRCARTGNPLHPTQKPVELLANILHVFHAARLVVDPFGGSGGTLIAAAQMNRTARLIELEPKFCDVIRRRWYDYATEHELEPGSGALAPAH